MPIVEKPLLRVLNGARSDRPPTWLMRQAGRYLPEYRALRAEKGGFLALATDPVAAAEVTLQPIRRFGFDGAILFSDILMVPWALGQPLRFAEGEGPLLEPLRDAEAIAGLRPEGFLERARPIFETVALLSATLAVQHQRTALIGFAGAPWTVACYMVEGRGGGEFVHARRMAFGDPLLFGRLIRTLTEATAEYLLAQVRAGAEALMLFDSWAGLLPPSQFRRWVIEPTGELVRRLRKQLPPGFPIIGFPRMAGPMLVEYAARAGVQAVGMDTAMDPRWAAANLPPGLALQGNLDPQALVAGGAALEAEARSLMAAMRNRPYVFNLGHGIVPQTPPENVAALVRMVRAAV